MLDRIESETTGPDWDFQDFMSLRGNADSPDRGKDVIADFVREGEVLLIGSSSKAGKSWLVGNLIWAAVSGGTWLGKEVRQGRVLLIDNELPPAEIDWRQTYIAREMHHEPKQGELACCSRRGEGCDIQAIEHQIAQLQWDWSEFSLVVVDALYKTIPDGRSENDNEAMAKLMNTIQSIAKRTNVPFVGVHHSPKGNQGDKSVLDVFAGAGAFGRSLDNAVIIRDHTEPGLFVADFITRSHAPLEQVSLRFDWPVWHCVETMPELKQRQHDRVSNQRKKDEVEKEKILAMLPNDGKVVRQQRLLDGLGYGLDRLRRLLAILEAEKKVKRATRKPRNGGRRAQVVSKLQSTEPTSESTSG